MIPPMSTGQVLLVEDDAVVREATAQSLELAGFRVIATEAAEAALEIANADFDGVVVSDLRMPGTDGLTLFRHLQELDRELPVVLITGHGDIRLAVQSLQAGAFDFLAKPFATEHLAASVRRALQARSLVLENRRLRLLLDRPDGRLLGESPVIESLRRRLPQWATTGLDALIEGETGTGKALVARCLHEQSRRAGGPFVTMNCTGMGEGAAEALLFGVPPSAASSLLVEATGGTLYLEEVDQLPQGTQARLLRTLESGELVTAGRNPATPIDVRLIAGTREHLAAFVQQGRFRSDLYFRLSPLRILLPPLRERREDIAPLFARFLREALMHSGQSGYSLDTATRRKLMEYRWPGNVRELRSYAFSVVLGTQETPAETPPSAPLVSLATRVDDFEKMLLREALETTHGNVVQASELLQTPRKTLYEKFARHELQPENFRRRVSRMQR